MKLSALDLAVLNHEGTPQETLQELLGWTLTRQSAKNVRARIRRYLRHKNALPEPDDELSENKAQSIEICESEKSRPASIL